MNAATDPTPTSEVPPPVATHPGGRIEARAAKISIVNGVTTVLTMVFQIVSVPVCLKQWGREPYGTWLALFSAFMLLRSLDGGFVTYVGNELNFLYHRDQNALRRHLASAVTGIFVISALQLALAAGTLFVEPIAAALGVPATHTDALGSRYGLILLMISWTVTGSYLGLVHRLMIPAGLMYQAAWWAMGFQVTQFAATMAAALLHLDMLHTSVLFALSQVVIYISSAYYVRVKQPAFTPWLRDLDPATGLTDLGKSLAVTGSNLIQQGAINGAVVLVAALAGPVAVPIFTTIRTIANLWTSVTTVLTQPLLPEVVRLHATGQGHKLVALNQAYWVTVGSIVNWGALLSFPLLPLLYAWWTRHAVGLDHSLLCFMLASVVAANAGALMTLHLNGINRLRLVLGTSVVRAALSLGVGAAGFARLGLTSFGIGIFAGELGAALLTGRYFFKTELAQHRTGSAEASLGPVLLGTGSTLVFFTGSAFGWWSGMWPWAAAVAAAAFATRWGWSTLDNVLRNRLVDLATAAFRRLSPR